MRILIGTFFMNKPQGTQTWTYTLATALKRLGHEVVVTSFRPGHVCDELNKQGIVHLLVGTKAPLRKFDLVICNHNPMLKYLLAFKSQFGPLVCFIHGIHPKKEQPGPGADYYVAVSEEVRQYVALKGVPVAAVIPNFVDTARWAQSCTGITPKEKPQRLFYMSHYRRLNGLLQRVCQDRGMEFYASPNDTMHIDDLMRRADVVVSLGRGIVETIAAGRGAFVGDHSTVIGSPLGDGLLDTAQKINASMQFNFNGKATRTPIDEKFLHFELDRWDYEICNALQIVAWAEFDVYKAIETIFEIAGVK